jgi:D-alanine-D-alanine ligase-like ATP-grasp enzyme
LIKDFYNYSDKYKNNEAQVKIPANISIKETQQIKALAEKI